MSKWKLTTGLKMVMAIKVPRYFVTTSGTMEGLIPMDDLFADAELKSHPAEMPEQLTMKVPLVTLCCRNHMAECYLIILEIWIALLMRADRLTTSDNIRVALLWSAGWNLLWVSVEEE